MALHSWNLSLLELDARRVQSASPFPEVSSYTFHLDNAPPLVCALAPGGPRIVWGDLSEFVADPNSRQGVNIEGIRLLLAAAGERVLSESVSPPTVLPVGIDPAANAVGGSSGQPRVVVFGADLYSSVDLGPMPFAVALVYDTPGEGREYLPGAVADAMYAAGEDPQDFFLVQGADIGRIDPGSRRIEVRLSGPGPFDAANVADEVLRRINGG